MKPERYVRSLIFTLKEPVSVETKYHIRTENIKTKHDTGIPETSLGTYCEK